MLSISISNLLFANAMFYVNILKDPVIYRSMVIRLICIGMYTIKFQVNLEARVVFCSSVGRGLIEEAKSIFADYLLLCGSRNQSHRWKTQRA